MNPVDVLKANEGAVVRAGLTLVALGTELVAGRIDDALAQAEAASRKFPEWVALEKTPPLRSGRRRARRNRCLRSSGLS